LAKLLRLGSGVRDVLPPRSGVLHAFSAVLLTLASWRLRRVHHTDGRPPDRGTFANGAVGAPAVAWTWRKGLDDMTLHDMWEQAPRRRGTGRPASPLRLPFAVLGLVAGLAVGSMAYDSGWTWPGVVLAFAVAAGIVGMVLIDAVVGPRRVARVLYRSLLIVAGVGGFALAALAWGPTWLALLVGGGLGAAAGVGLGFLLFRDLALKDWRGGRAEGQRVIEAGPDDWVSGRRDAFLVAAMLTTFVALAFTGWGVLAYVLTGLAFAALLLASAIATIRRRRSAHR
jgi:hypothetical protein